MNVSLRVMRYFATASYLQSLSRAAVELHISQSAISSAIDTLEAELGLKLLFRKRSKGISLTAAGHSTLVKIQSILDHVDNFKNEIANLGDEISGELHVGCFSAIAPIVLTPILKELSIDHPSVNIVLSEGNALHIFDSIHRGEIDVGISYDEADLSDGLTVKTLAIVPPHVIVPANHPFAKLNEIPISILADQPLILLDMPSSSQYYTSLFETTGFTPDFAYKTPNYDMVRSLVAAGLGMAILQTRSPSNATHFGANIVCKPLTGKFRKSRLVIAYNEFSIKRRAVKTFVDYTQSYFQSPASQKIIVLSRKELLDQQVPLV
ncbi:MAG: LysR substrate-binding domain-containing protein [Sneathiella sp.]